MSVLKYNNNGTWEGLNIDHASTADSALYDADGNVISSTYLPRSAGSDNPVTGNIFMDKSGYKEINLETNGVREATFSSNGTNIYIGLMDSNGVQKGMAVETGYLKLFNNGSAVVFRPNGLASNVGEAYVNTRGLIEGTQYKTGWIVDANDQNHGAWAKVGQICTFTAYLNAASWSANTWTQLGKATQSMPAPAAIVPRFVAIADSGNGYSVLQVGLGRYTEGKQLQFSFPTASTTARAITICGSYRCDANT